MTLGTRWERLFNWQSDQGWTWGPLLRLRPPRCEPISPWLWVRLFLILTTLGSGVLGLLVAGADGAMRGLAARRTPLPPALAETQATLIAMASDRATQALLLGLLFCVPPLFFAFCLPYHWAWNRRAARMRQEKPDGIEGKPLSPGVWPPPIDRRA